MTKITLKKPRKKAKETSIEVRVSNEQKNKIKQKALLYAEGNMSRLVLKALENYVPRREDLEIKTP